MTFHLQQRIRVLEGPLRGRAGTVVQLRRSDRGAFVEMDKPLPKKVPKVFSAQVRDRWVILQPGEAEPEASAK